MSARQSRVDHFNAGAAGSEHETSWEADRRAGVRSLHGSKDIERLFPGQIPKTLTPWPGANKRTLYTPRLTEGVHAELEREPRTVDIDPRILTAGQPHLVRAGVEHYMGDEFERTGRTFEPGHNVGNQFPFVVTKRSNSPNMPEYEHVLLSGHHRAAAALLRGRKLTTRWIEQS